MYREALLEEIKRGEISQVYLFQGEEEYLKTEALNRIKKVLLPTPDAEGFNFRTFYGKDLNCAEFLEEANTFPALSDNKLLVIREGDKLNISSRNKISQALAVIPSSTHLIFFFKKVDKRQRFFQAVQKKGNCVYFYPLKEGNLKLWVAAQFKQRKKTISPEALAFLLERAGRQLQDLEKEIEKISLFVGNRPQVELYDSITASSAYQTHTLYELLDKILTRETQASLTILSRLMEDKRGTELIGLFYWQYSHLWKAKFLQEKGASSEQIGRELGIPVYHLAKFLNKAGSFSKEKLKAVFLKLFQGDLHLKSTQMPPRLTLELLVINLCATI